MTDTSPIHAVVAAWGDAFCRKDTPRLMALYAPDAVIYDAIPPFASHVDGLRAKVADCLRYFPDDFAVETREVQVEASGDLASAHFIWHFTKLPPGHPAGRHWLRSSLVLRRTAEGWRIIHDHCSAPFDPYTEKVVLSPEADSQPAHNHSADSNPVGWFEIYVADMARAKTFYSKVFGYAFTRLESPVELWAFPMQPWSRGISGALARIDGLEPGGKSVIVYFVCDDCGATATKAAQAGGQIVKPKFSIGQYGHIALVSDSEGNMIGLHSMS